MLPESRNHSDGADLGPRRGAAAAPTRRGSENARTPRGPERKLGAIYPTVHEGSKVSRRLRIAAHNGARGFGGGEKWTLQLLAELQARDHEVHLFVRDHAMVERARSFEVPASVGRLGGQIMLPQAWHFARQLRGFAPDALLLSTFKKVWLGGMAARLAHVPRVVSRIGLDSDLPRRSWMYRVAYRRWIDAVLVNADGIRAPFLEDLPGYDPSRVATVYDGVRLENVASVSSARPEMRAELSIPDGVPVVGTITRLSIQKRIDRLLDAMALLPDAHLIIAGEGELGSEMRAHAVELEIADRVHFLGFRSDVARVLSAFDVFALTSDKEGMANAMLESLAAGVPVVSTEVSGAREALGGDERGHVAGLVVETSAEAVAEGLRGVLSDGVWRESMAGEARRRARARFDFVRMVDAWEAVLGGERAVEVHQGT